LRLKTAAGFPARPAEIYAIYRSQIFELTQRNGGLELSGKPPETLSNHFSREKLSPMAYANANFSGPSGDLLAHDAALRLMPLLLARAAKVPEVFPSMVSAPDHHADLQLLIVAPAPPSFQLQGPGFTHETGWVLYVQDVFKP
jgi:hypothetical protein